MATSITNQYLITTPPYSTERMLGSLASIMGRQFRYSTFEGLAPSGGLPCGVFVTMSTTAGVNTFNQLSGATDKIFGVSYLNTQRILDWDSTFSVYKYQAGDLVSLIEEGDIYMYAEAAVTAGDPVWTRHTADGALTRIGAVAPATGTGLVQVTGAKFLETITAPGVVKVSLPDVI